MGIIKEFKEFALRGNLIDMAVAVVIGTAFNKVVSSFIDGIIMPLIGKVILNIDFGKLNWVLQEEVKQGEKIITPQVTVQIGHLITQTLDFIIVAFVVFMVIKTINRLKRKEENSADPVVAPSKEEVLLTEIRDLLKNK